LDGYRTVLRIPLVKFKETNDDQSELYQQINDKPIVRPKTTSCSHHVGHVTHNPPSTINEEFLNEFINNSVAVEDDDLNQIEANDDSKVIESQDQIIEEIIPQIIYSSTNSNGEMNQKPILKTTTLPKENSFNYVVCHSTNYNNYNVIHVPNHNLKSMIDINDNKRVKINTKRFRSARNKYPSSTTGSRSRSSLCRSLNDFSINNKYNKNIGYSLTDYHNEIKALNNQQEEREEQTTNNKPNQLLYLTDEQKLQYETKNGVRLAEGNWKDQLLNRRFILLKKSFISSIFSNFKV
jgi:hypothetical protein